MRYILLSVLFVVCAHAWGATYTVESIPDQRLVNGSHISDPDAILDDDSKAAIDRRLIGLEALDGVQIAVVAVESIGDADLVSFAQDLFVQWKIGHRGRDDGLLILLVKDKRTVRLHTGYGLEGVLPDVVCSRIIRERMLPEFGQERYGAGVLAAIDSIEARLSRRGVASPIESDTPAIIAPSAKNAMGVLVFFTLFAFVVFVSKFARGHFFLHVVTRQLGWPESLHWNGWYWLLIYYVMPVAIGGACLSLAQRAPWTTLIVGMYACYLALTIREAVVEARALAQWRNKRRYGAVDRLLHGRHGFWLRRALLFPVPFLFLYLFQLGRRQRLRNAPRTCSRCKAPMRKLDPMQERERLSAAEQTEEDLRAVDYDLWACTACANTLRIAYDGKRKDDYQRCPKCKRRTFTQESDRELVKATEDAAGQGEIVRVCKHCGHSATSTYRIPRIVSSSSSSGSSSDSSSSSSSSSGSSWGGGDSGGGGASGSW